MIRAPTSTIFAPIKIHSSTTKATSRYDDVTFVKAGLVCVIMIEFVIVPRIATTVSTDSQVPMSSAPLGQGRFVFWHIFQPSTLISMKLFTHAKTGASGNADTKSVA